MAKKPPKRAAKSSVPASARTRRKSAAGKKVPPPRTKKPLGPAEPAPAATAPAAPPESRWGIPTSFPIVGIGTSAGGLEALEQFFSHVPANCGVAFVIIQHLDPLHKGMLVELLQRGTAIPILQAEDGLRIRRDHVYVIPPNKDMSVLHGKLHLLPQATPRGLNLPIDFFFRSLAEDQQDRGIAVILSGMGSDGTLGLRAIKEKAGAVFVQSANTAKFDGMPRSAIDTGLADVVAPVDKLPEKILAYCQRTPRISTGEQTLEEKTASALAKVFVLLRAHTGNDFSQYKKSTIVRRIERRMGLHQIDNVAHYVRYLRENPREIELLFKELLIGVTSFFRDPPAWELLKIDIIPSLLSSRASGGVVRAWVPGCSTGEEAYSLAMVFKEALEPFSPVKHIALQIFATDLDRDAIERARVGLYPNNIAADVAPERLRRYFVQEERGFRVGKEIREMVVFAPQNLLMDPPFTKLDILCCRNLLIYLSGEVQKRLIPLFHYSLNPGGVLFLGTAETIGSFSTLFAPLDGKTRLYRRLESVVTVPFDLPTAPITGRRRVAGRAEAEESGPELPAPPAGAPPNLQTLADRVLVQRFAPVGILCNDKGDVLYISGRAGRYLEPPVGKANLNIFAMAREGLRYDLSSAFTTALREERLVTVRGVHIGTDGGAQVVDLTVQRLLEPKELRGTVLIVINDTSPGKTDAPPARTPRAAVSPRLAEMEQELHRAREEVQTAREEMQTSQEELKSTNEELQSTNEELQSSNEELTTSKEEMQSLNEELQTVNHELQAKVDELSRSNSDMKNLLNSTDIATLFLDGDLNVRRFTAPTSRIIKLIPTDAGRPITDITSDLDYADLADDAREVLRTLVFKEKQVATRDKRWYSVRIMPYRTVDNVIDGVVITFTDMSAARGNEAAMLEQTNQLRKLNESLPNLVFGCRANGSCDFLGRQWIDYTGIPESEHLGYGWMEQAHPDDRERLWEGWRAAIKAGTTFDADLRLRNVGGSYRWFKVRAVPSRDADGAIQRWFGSFTDVDELKRGDRDRSRSHDRLSAILDAVEEGVIELDAELRVTFFNAAAEQLFGRRRADVVGMALLDVFPHLRASNVQRHLDEALRARKPATFESHLDGVDAHAGVSFRIRVKPEGAPGGLSLLVQPVGNGSPRT